MARIRSTHPGQWTDEDFVECSPFARLLAIALRNEADDFGVFEWKPVGLKMRCMPADAVDIIGLLAELVEHSQVRRFVAAGRSYGAIRNFCVYQRPKEPAQRHPLPADIAGYVGLGPDDYRFKKASIGPASGPVDAGPTGDSAPPPQDFPNASPTLRKSAEQMEDVGDSLDDEGKTPPVGPPRQPEPPPSASADPIERPPDRSRGTRLPEGWQPTPDLIEFARKEGLSDADIERERERFRDHWLGAAGQRGRKSDWAAAWRNWARKAADDRRRFAGRSSSPGGGGSGNGRADRPSGIVAGSIAVLRRRQQMAGFVH